MFFMPAARFAQCDAHRAFRCIAHPQLRKSKSNHVLLVPKPSAKLKMLSARKSPTRRDAQRSSTNTVLDPLDTLDLSSNVKPKLKLILNSLPVFPTLMASTDLLMFPLPL